MGDICTEISDPEGSHRNLSRDLSKSPEAPGFFF